MLRCQRSEDVTPAESSRVRCRRRAGATALLAAVSVALAACAEDPEALAPSPAGSGPRIVHDLFALPLPEIPFPNDLATRYDPGSPTGRRVNASLVAPTVFEAELRAQLAALDGFGTYAPITVSFDEPLDLDAVLSRHGRDRDPADDAVYVVAIDPTSPDFGEPVALDLGRGFFPATLPEGTEYFPADPRQGAISVVFETVDEDLDGDGRLDPGEDTDHDGVLDVPNVHPRGASPADGLLTWYERESNTLILRPIRPLRERTEYAVVLTRRLLGEDGQPVRSPFAGVNHTEQTPSLRRLDAVFAVWRAQYGIDLDRSDVAFAWTFTTQTVTADLVALREGLYGVGPFAWLATSVPPAVAPAAATTDGRARSPLLFSGQSLRSLVSLAFAELFDLTPAQVAGLDADLSSIDFVAQGWFDAPDLLTSEAAPFDQTWALDRATGQARVETARLPFLVVVPRASEWGGPPYRVAIYGHGFGQARIEPLAFAAVLARYGIATVAIDTWGHGINLSATDREALLTLGDVLQVRPFLETMLEGRARDVDGDGRVDAGADMYSSYGFHTRDTMRQSALDHLQLVRALRGFDGVARWTLPDGSEGLAGDFDGDGVVDIGGPDAPYYMWGSSMGGLLTGVVAPLEPAIVAAAPVAGGAGLSSFARRSRQDSVRANTVMGVIGPVIVGRPADDADPDESGATARVTYVYPVANELREALVGELPLAPGDGVLVENIDAGEARRAFVLADGTFAVPIPTDVGDRLRVTIEPADGGDAVVFSRWAADVFDRLDEPPRYAAGSPLRAPNEGWGLHRGSPEFRRLIGLSQLALEPGDPINYARHFIEEPLDIRPEGPTETNLLVISTVGDPMNPSDVHGAAAVAAGILDLDAEDARYGMPAADWLIANHVLEGVCGFGRFPPNADGVEVLFDPDALDRTTGRGPDANGFGAPQPAPGDELRATLDTPGGQSGLRYGHMLPCGKHSFFLTDPSNPFNIDEYLNSLAGYYFATNGRVILDDGCHEDSSCPLPEAPE
jgi:hypothetical protein